KSLPVFLLAILFQLCTSCGGPQLELVSEVKVESEVSFVNGELDAGYMVTFSIRNNGDQGEIFFTTTLSCSEGSFIREQPYVLAANQTKEFSFFFHEPTISATNVQARVNVR
ncbi:MAG: hypothetical protein AAFR97_06055, partial [Bacteroidota bacterium]